MYYEIEGRFGMKTIIFDEEGVTVGTKVYPADEIERIEITSAPLFATYGILTIRTGGIDVPVPFARGATEKIRRALHNYERAQMEQKNAAEKAAKQAAQAESSSRSAYYDDVARYKQEAAESQAAQEQPAQPAQPQPAHYMDPYEEVKKLKELLDMGIVTEEEFQKKKKELLGL